MFTSKSKAELNSRLPGYASMAILFSFVSLLVSAGVARWSWLIMNEQISLRQDFLDLRNEQSQTSIQYEYWLNKLQDERAAIKAK